MQKPLAAFVASIALLATSPALADSFAPPSIQEARSASGEVVATIIPAMLSCAQGEDDCKPAARAVMEFDRGGWRGPSRTVLLRNPEAPGQVLVSDDGTRLLTVNDYASAGHGDNVLVLYGEQGEVIAHYGLADFLPEDYLNGLPRTASSIRWMSDPVRIDEGNRRAIVSLFVVTRDGDLQRSLRDGGIELALDLDTGELERPSGPRWENARNCARTTGWAPPEAQMLRERERYAALCR